MIINVKYWNEGGTAPAGWTALDVDECYPRYQEEIYNSVTGIDKTKRTWISRYLLCSIVCGPAVLLNPTYLAVVTAIQAADYFRIFDTRHAALTTSNTIDFTRLSPAKRDRDAKTLASESITFELTSTGVQ